MVTFNKMKNFIKNVEIDSLFEMQLHGYHDDENHLKHSVSILTLSKVMMVMMMMTSQI